MDLEPAPGRLDEGLYGLDVLETYTADVAGTYQVWMQNYEVTPLAYRVVVREPGTAGSAADDGETAKADGKG